MNRKAAIFLILSSLLLISPLQIHAQEEYKELVGKKLKVAFTEETMNALWRGDELGAGAYPGGDSVKKVVEVTFLGVNGKFLMFSSVAGRTVYVASDRVLFMVKADEAKEKK